MANTFGALGVHDRLVRLLASEGITVPFPVQTATIPDLIAGRDVVGRAPTGSGKTLAFGIPLVMALERAQPKRPTGLILAPTRELAEQIALELQPLTRTAERRILPVYGGISIEHQIKRLAKGVDVVVATPGRLEDLLERDFVSLADVSIVVIDEADRMADMGFLPAVRRILDQTRRNRQTALFSATIEGGVSTVVSEYQQQPVWHEIGPASPDIHEMTHQFWKVPRPSRIALCAFVAAKYGRTIVFTRTRHGANRATQQLMAVGVIAVAIHGDRSQAQRQAALAAFSTGEADVLVATDVAARGIHVDGVECVVHFDPVDEDSAYIHRSGRTARAGAEGQVISFVDPGQVRLVNAMKRRLNLPQEITDPPEIKGAAAAKPLTSTNRSGSAMPGPDGRPSKTRKERNVKPERKGKAEARKKQLQRSKASAQQKQGKGPPGRPGAKKSSGSAAGRRKKRR